MRWVVSSLDEIVQWTFVALNSVIRKIKPFGTEDDPIIFQEGENVPGFIETYSPWVSVKFKCDCETFSTKDGVQHVYPVWEESSVLMECANHTKWLDGIIVGQPTHIHNKPRNNPKAKKKILEKESKLFCFN